MRFRHFIKIIRSRWLFICVFVLIVELILGFSIHFLMPERYEATVTLFVSRTANELNNDSYDLDSKLLNTYRKIAYNDTVLAKAAQDAGVDLRVEEIRKRVRISNIRGTNLVNIQVWSHSPEMSANLANSLGSTLINEIRNHLQIDNLQAIEAAVPQNNPYRMNIVIALIAGLIASFFLAIIITLILNALDDTLRTVEEISDLFGRPVIGQIPHGVTRLRRR